jgi:lysine 2,3-aminomutase
MESPVTIRKTQSTDLSQQWRWQEQNAITSIERLLDVFPGLSAPTSNAIAEHLKSRRLRITPHILKQIRRTEDNSAPLLDDPIWRQLVPFWHTEGETLYSYDGHTENWEMPHEMVTPIGQHKYDNRIIVRLSNVCHSYCQFCYESLRTLENKSSKLPLHAQHWEDTVAYIRRNPAIEEVILSGGEPLMHSDDMLERVLADLRGLDRWIAIRIHTRALTFNPFRINDFLIEILKRYNLNSLGVHIAHPQEITPEFRETAKHLQTATPIMFANIPLLRGINDDTKTMHDLCMALYGLGIIPHYLYHFMPHSPGSQEFRTSVQKGVDIVASLKRRISNLAVPEFVLPHHTGKHTVPLLRENEEPFSYGVDDRGNAFVRYTNWEGKLVEYPDVME